MEAKQCDDCKVQRQLDAIKKVLEEKEYKNKVNVQFQMLRDIRDILDDKIDVLTDKKVTFDHKVLVTLTDLMNELETLRILSKEKRDKMIRYLYDDVLGGNENGRRG